MKKGADRFTMIQEAARCLLCHDAPCAKACPAQNRPDAMVRSVRFDNVKGAVRALCLRNPLAGICAYTCGSVRACEAACTRAKLDDPVRIGKLEKWVCAQEAENYLLQKRDTVCAEKVAVIGSGAAGLSAAAYLVECGCSVTVFESQERVGGWLTHGLPEWRVPRKTVLCEIRALRIAGVSIRSSMRIGRDQSLDSLFEEGFRAVLIAVGSQADILQKLPGIPGRNLHNVGQGRDFLLGMLAKPQNLAGKSITVYGGNDMAWDCARIAHEAGAKAVTLISPHPAHNFEEAAGINDLCGFEVTRLHGADGRVCAAEAANGENGARVVLPADQVLFAESLSAYRSMARIVNLTKTPIKIGGEFTTNLPGVFACGNWNTGSQSAVEAVGKGREAAGKVLSYLRAGAAADACG